MQSYRFNYIDGAGNVRRVEVVGRRDNADAVRWGNDMLAVNPLHAAVEIWDGDRLIITLKRKTDP
jgi:hypothetical protein